MKFSRNILLAAAATITIFCHISDVRACKGGGGGGYSRGFSGGGYSSRSYGGYNSRPVSRYSYPSHSVSYGQPISNTQLAPSAPRFAQQPQQQFAQPQQVPQQQFAQQPQPRRQAASSVSTQAATAPQAAQVPRQQNIPTQAPATTAPAVQAPAAGNARMSALQALGGFAPPAAAPAQNEVAGPPPTESAPPAPAHVGTWTATLGNGATVRLSLEADGRFNWIATNASGSSSSFSGNYTVNNGSLNLNRSNDGQQLSGGMSIDGNDAFSFQVAGNNAAAINFARS